MIDFNSPIPLYYQIMERIYDEIKQGTWDVGEKIPSEFEISSKFGVSRNTTQRAIEMLVNKGLLVRKQGVGTFVSSPQIEQGLMGFYSFSKAMQAQGISTSVKVVSMEKEVASSSQAKYLEIGVGDEMHVLKRIRYANDSPIMFDTSRIPVSIAPDLEKTNFENNSLYYTLETRYGIYVTRAKEIFEPVSIRALESKLLEVPENSPAMMLDRIAYSSQNIPVELCRSIVPGDKCRFYTELR
jgi:GntR family transcriptional regulator